MLIDTSFDFRTDAGGKDPDIFSPTLRRYHRFLWSKPLPNGILFDLHDSRHGAYLYHKSALGEFFLSSDSVMPTFSGRPALQVMLETFPQAERDAFKTVTYTMGGMMVFPGNQVDRKLTINCARGFNRKIADRFDLTLECIRRYYLGQPSPLRSTFDRYRDFFCLFETFKGYVDFFLLQDLVAVDYSAVTLFMPFADFTTPAIPGDFATYKEFRRLSIQFVAARNKRIECFCSAQGSIAERSNSRTWTCMSSSAMRTES